MSGVSVMDGWFAVWACVLIWATARMLVSWVIKRHVVDDFWCAAIGILLYLYLATFVLMLATLTWRIANASHPWGTF